MLELYEWLLFLGGDAIVVDFQVGVATGLRERSARTCSCDEIEGNHRTERWRLSFQIQLWSRSALTRFRRPPSIESAVRRTDDVRTWPDASAGRVFGGHGYLDGVGKRRISGVKSELKASSRPAVCRSMRLTHPSHVSCSEAVNSACLDGLDVRGDRQGGESQEHRARTVGRRSRQIDPAAARP